MNEEDLKQKVRAYLQSHPLAVVATASYAAKPEAALVEFLLDEQSWNLYFVTHDDTEKVKNIQGNNEIALVVGTELGVNNLQARGTAHIIQQHDKVFSDLLVKFAGMKSFYTGPLLKFRKLNLVIVQVTLENIRWLDFNQQTGKEEYITIAV